MTLQPSGQAQDPGQAEEEEAEAAAAAAAETENVGETDGSESKQAADAENS